METHGGRPDRVSRSRKREGIENSATVGFGGVTSAAKSLGIPHENSSFLTVSVETLRPPRGGKKGGDKKSACPVRQREIGCRRRGRLSTPRENNHESTSIRKRPQQRIESKGKTNTGKNTEGKGVGGGGDQLVKRGVETK